MNQFEFGEIFLVGILSKKDIKILQANLLRLFKVKKDNF
jgi:hypothetical protein